MKKIILILFAAVAMLCGCAKSASTVAAPDAPKVASLNYDTASTYFKNTGNRATVYDVNGRYVKVTVGALRDEVTYKADYFITALPFHELPAPLYSKSATGDQTDDEKEMFIHCMIYKIEGEGYTNVNQVDITAIPEASEFSEYAEAVEGGAYYVALFDPEGNAHLTFAVVLPSFKKTPYKADVEYDPESPFGGPIIVNEDFETSVITLFYRQFENGKWL